MSLFSFSAPQTCHYTFVRSALSLTMMSPDSSRILYLIFKDSNIYSTNIRQDGKIVPSTNFEAQRSDNERNFAVSLMTCIDEFMAVYSRYSILFMILYVLMGLYALVHDQHVCNVDMTHDNSDAWIFGSIYLVLSFIIGLATELLIFSISKICLNLEYIYLTSVRVGLHFLASLGFFIYENIVIYKDGAMCREMKGTCLYYWIYLTYYLLMFRLFNFFTALCTLVVSKVNQEPMSTTEREKQDREKLLTENYQQA